MTTEQRDGLEELGEQVEGEERPTEAPPSYLTKAEVEALLAQRETQLRTQFRQEIEQTNRHWQGVVDSRIAKTMTQQEQRFKTLEGNLQDTRSRLAKTLDPEERRDLEIQELRQRLELTETRKETPEAPVSTLTPEQETAKAWVVNLADALGVNWQDPRLYQGIGENETPDSFRTKFRRNAHIIQGFVEPETPETPAPVTRTAPKTPPIVGGGQSGAQTEDKIYGDYIDHKIDTAERNKRLRAIGASVPS